MLIDSDPPDSQDDSGLRIRPGMLLCETLDPVEAPY
jgi:hypothetical protein